MRRTARWIPAVIAAGMVAGLGGTPAVAAGPVDGKVGAFWWNNDFSVDGESGFNEDSASAFGGFAELWIVNRLGFRAKLLRSDVSDVGSGADTVEYRRVDAMFRLVSPSENNYFALGLGWEEADIDLGPLWGDTHGPLVKAEGSVGLVGILSLYGDIAYLPDMDDIEPASALGGTLEDIEGLEYEIGLAFQAVPFVQFRVAFHHVEFDATRSGVVVPHDVTTESEGWMAGVAITF